MTTLESIAGIQNHLASDSMLVRTRAPAQPEQRQIQPPVAKAGATSIGVAGRNPRQKQGAEIIQTELRFRVDEVGGKAFIEVWDSATGELIRRIAWREAPRLARVFDGDRLGRILDAEA